MSTRKPRKSRAECPTSSTEPVAGSPEDDNGEPTVRLAVTSAMVGNAGDSTSGPHRYPHHKARIDEGPLLKPALLVSFVYLEKFLRHRHRYSYRDWVLDSGAFSAHNSGTVIEIEDYIAKAKELQSSDVGLSEIFALDVIGDWRASLKNCEKMWAAGVEAIPCYHVGEPWDVLTGIARDYPKIALGGAVGFKGKDEWAGQCFARVWPKKIHGFGFGSEKSVMLLPWHSVDATNWELGPCKFGRWNAFGQMSIRGSKQNLRAEVEWYLALERRARKKWAAQMSKLETIGPDVRFGLNGQGQGETNGALGPPVVRLATKGWSSREGNLGKAEESE